MKLFFIYALTAIHFYLIKSTRNLFFVWFHPVFRIRMDPGFFADPDPGFKSLDPDPSSNKLMESK